MCSIYVVCVQFMFIHILKTYIETMAFNNSSVHGVDPLTPSSKGRKRLREASNIATITRSPRTMPPPPRPSPINIDSPPSTDDVNHPSTVVVPTVEASKSLLSLLGGALQFSKAVQVVLPPATLEILSVVPKEDLFQDNIEMLCWCLVMTRLGTDGWVHVLIRVGHSIIGIPIEVFPLL